jgi:hypothetical protein
MIIFLKSPSFYSAKGVDVLGDVVSRPELRRWEMDDAHDRFELELDINDERPEISTLHKTPTTN